MTSVLTAPVKKSVVEPGGIEGIALERRHGSPWQLLTTWTAPNLEFATIFLGVLAVGVFGLPFPVAVAALLVGNALGGLTHGILSSWGPRDGVAQMVLGRTAFGTRGNAVPSALNMVMAGVGWFAVNSVSGALALSVLTGVPAALCLVAVVVLEVGVAFVGHDLVQGFERYASVALGVVFAAGLVFALANGDLGAGAGGQPGAVSFATVTLTISAALGYAAGWNPYASDYTRYLAPGTSRLKTGLAAGVGNFVSCTLLMTAGAAAATVAGLDLANPTGSYTAPGVMPEVLGKLTLVAIAVGAVAANAINVYSGSMSFLAMGVKLPFGLRRAIVALGFGVIGFVVALLSLPDAGHAYESFLLVIAYWVAPWLGVVLTDRLLRRGTSIAPLLGDDAGHRNRAGLVAFVVATVVSVALFSGQSVYAGPLSGGLGDVTPFVGFALAAVLMAVLSSVWPSARGPRLAAHDAEPVPVHVDAASAR